MHFHSETSSMLVQQGSITILIFYVFVHWSFSYYIQISQSLSYKLSVFLCKYNLLFLYKKSYFYSKCLWAMPAFLRNKIIILILKNENLSLKLDICIPCGIQKNIHNYLLQPICQVLLFSNKIAKLSSYAFRPLLLNQQNLYFSESECVFGPNFLYL